MRRTLWWAERLALLLFAAITLPGATSAAQPPGTSNEAPAALPARASAGPGFAAPSAFPLPDLAPRLSVIAAPGAALASPPLGAPSPLVRPVPAPPSPAPEAQVIALYGYPGIPTMGALGRYEPDDAAAEVARLAAEWDAANGDRPAVGALHLITSVAQPWPMADGSYLARMEPEQIAVYVEAARRNRVLLILDVQVGMADPLREVRRLEPFLAEPFVQLALDPEFAMHRKGGAPGERIGSLDAADVNEVARYLGGLVRERGLPEKLLVVHQFRADMLTGTDAFEDVPGVQRTIDMDGWGGQSVKLDNYALYSLAPYAQRPAIKLFYEWDQPLFTIDQLLALPRVPDLVIYQ